MIRSCKVVSVLLTALTGLFMVSCATDQAAKMRAERKTTVGSNVSNSLVAEYRPADNYGVDFAYYSSFGRSSSSYELMDNNLSLFGSEDGQRALDRSSMNSFTAAGSWYPWATSAFRVGAGLTQSTGEISFDSPQVNADAKWRQVRYDISSTYLTLPLGWNWIFETLEGFTFGWDIALNYRMLNNSSLTSSDSSIDTANRDAYFKRFENSQKVVYGSVLSHIGYSF